MLFFLGATLKIKMILSKTGFVKHLPFFLMFYVLCFFFFMLLEAIRDFYFLPSQKLTIFFLPVKIQKLKLKIKAFVLLLKAMTDIKKTIYHFKINTYITPLRILNTILVVYMSIIH